MSKLPDLYVKYVHRHEEPKDPIPLVIAPSLGTSVDTLWARALPVLRERFSIISWDLPGHGQTRAADAAFTVESLAEALLQKLSELNVSKFYFAGVSIGGAVGLQLALMAPERVVGLGFLCSSACFGEPADWKERAKQVRQLGTPHLIIPTVSRWFAEGFLDRDPDISGRILNNLRDADNESYALAAEALSVYNLESELVNVKTPMLAISGDEDTVSTPEDMERISHTVADGRYLNITGASHQAVAEKPNEVAKALISFFDEIV